MHYKNKVEAKFGHVVIGQTHNSKGAIRLGKIIELMPQQGPCNVKLLVFGFNPIQRPVSDDDRWMLKFYGSEILTTVRQLEGENRSIEVAVDYADVSELLRVEDCFRMLNSILRYGEAEAPYFHLSTEL